MYAAPERLFYLRDLFRELISRDIKLRYKRSFLGIAWSLLNPLAQLLVFSFVFRFVLPLNIPDYTSFLFTGLLVWNWFQSALLAGTGAIVDNRELVKRPGFPPVVLPLVNVGSAFIHFLLALPVLLIFLLLSHIPLTAAVWWLPVLFSVQFVFTTGVVFLFSAIHVTFRDTQYLLGIGLMLGFYLSPVLYNSEVVPLAYRWIYELNPMAVLIGAYRAILLQGASPDGQALFLLAIFSLLLVWAGYRVFTRMSYQFMDEL
jgi:lipopolysaccharide transport system permease protein